ncbi:hypothetical protein PINS_up002311 [Pythium insidiosum]|nr:hypothetical protein PINS_up002311 [Pythium insidiosum]
MSVTHDRVVVGMADASVLAVDLLHPERKIRLEGHTDAIVAVHQHGTTLISGSRDHTLRSWDVRATPRKRHIFGFFSQSDSSPVAADRQSAQEIDSASVSRRSIVMRGHSGPVGCVEVGRHLTTSRLVVASGSADGSVRLWDPCKDSSVSVMASSNRRPIKCLRYLAHFDSLISGSTEDVLEAWDVTTGACQTSFRAHRGAIRDVQVTGERLVTAGNDCNVKVWDARFRSGQSYSHALRNHGGPVLCVSLGGPADPNVCTGSADGVVRVWDLRYVHKGPRLALAGHLGPVTCLQRDFSKLVSASEDGSVRVWDMHSGVCSKDVKAHGSGVTCMALQDSRVVTGSWDGCIRVSDIEVSSIRTQDSG